MQFTARQYNLLERAITERRRVSITRRGGEFVVLPERIQLREGREAIETVQPSTGDRMTIYLDDIDAFEMLG